MTDAENTPQADQPTPDGAQNTENAGQTPATIPYDRFKDVNERMKKAELALARFEKAEADRLEKERLATGKHEEVIAELRPQAERAAQLEATLKEYLEAELADVPKDMRDLIPDGDAATQLKWVKSAKQRGLFARTPAPNTDAGAVGDSKRNVKLSDTERNLARQFGMTEEQYIEYKNK